MQALRHIADTQPRRLLHAAGGGAATAPTRRAQQRGLARTVGTDDGDDLAALHREVDIVQRQLRPQPRP